jgi:hypothetical protein
MCPAVAVGYKLHVCRVVFIAIKRLLPKIPTLNYVMRQTLNDSSESTYRTMIGSGAGQAIDPVNPTGNWTDTSGFVGLMTESATNLRYRDDFQFITASMQNQPGLQLVSGTYTAFSNNGSIPVNGSVTQSSALSDLSNRTAVLNALTTATDHLPVVADYTVTLPSVIDWKGGTVSAPTNWNDVANWSPNIAVPNRKGLDVNFGNQTSAGNVVNMISQGQTVGAISFAATTSTTIQSSGGFALTLDNSSGVSTIDVAGTHTISTLVVLNNNAIIIGTGTLNLSGGITGSHDLEVDINLTATSIQVDTLTIGNGATVTIQTIPGGPLSDVITPVPEPSTVVLLGISAVSLFAYAWRRRWAA